MKYSVGYQITDVRSYDGKTYMEYIVQNKEHISELYFSWGDIANGRCSMLQNDELLPVGSTTAANQRFGIYLKVGHRAQPFAQRQLLRRRKPIAKLFQQNRKHN